MIDNSTNIEHSERISEHSQLKQKKNRETLDGWTTHAARSTEPCTYCLFNESVYPFEALPLIDKMN